MMFCRWLPDKAGNQRSYGEAKLLLPSANGLPASTPFGARPPNKRSAIGPLLLRQPT
jgi:hypothetical protein